jgi:hypothetical protein
MPTPSQAAYYHRSPRARLFGTTPVALRFADGRHGRGELKVVSLTGGLLSLQRPLDWGCRVKLMFLSQTGVVLGEAEMLSPDCWSRQPFRFVALDESDQCRLRAAIELSLGQHAVGRVD